MYLKCRRVEKMDFDTAKENIQPLASGRNAEHLETALIAESDQEIQHKLHEQRKEFERTIETYSGEDPLQPWYDYIVWVEQIYPKSGKESALHELLARCLALFEKDERYFQDRRMVKLYIKYVSIEKLEFFFLLKSVYQNRKDHNKLWHIISQFRL